MPRRILSSGASIVGEIIKFPNIKDENTQKKGEILQARLEEIEVENKYMHDDIEYLSNALKRNIEEASNILKEFALINGLAKEEGMMEFTNEWGDDFEFTPEFDTPDKVEWPEQFEEGTVYPKQKDTATDKWDELANTTLDVSLKLLEDAVQQLKTDFNNDKPKDK